MYFNAKSWDSRNGAVLIKSATSCNDNTQVVRPYWVSNCVSRIVLAQSQRIEILPNNTFHHLIG